ncbi:caspase family protein [Nocardia sp. GCM10030253]|uniref:caspase family protein n=1 Tax=Nocardia sp. GCM10030253 TaxID=3273404 RepID=UPI00363D2261
MTLELGDHVWYWNGLISLDKNIPRLDWFPDANPQDPTDYRGHGKEIYNYVVHADEIARGRPHMRNHEGSFAWLNNNPGNITGIPGGPNYGQYPGKFNWHNFLIFPTWADGYHAIAALLRSASYRDLSILAAFERYAPASDGNDPVAYANAVAAALGLSVSTRVGDLDDNQMLVMQDKIQEVEGAIPGDSLAWDSEDIPPEIAGQLPAFRRIGRRPQALPRSGGPFSIAMSAPVDTSGYTTGLGGPNQGGHVGQHWYIHYGMDLGGGAGTPVYAAFDGHVTKYQPHDPALDSGKVYGAQIFMRAHNDMMGGFYTHLTDVPAGLGPGTVVARGDLLGYIYEFGGITPHLHLALVEIIGGAPSGQYVGVDLYQLFTSMQSGAPDTTVPVTFSQDGSPPEPSWRGARVGVLPSGAVPPKAQQNLASRAVGTSKSSITARQSSPSANGLPRARARRNGNERTSMTGHSLHIGLNRVDPDAYGGWDGRLFGCVNDANSMAAIAAAEGFATTRKLLDDEATSYAIIGEIGQLAYNAQPGDLVLITYSGHGGQTWDADGEEEDSQDETWVAFDRQIVDDELYRMWAQFAPGVRIVVCSDSCHSGTVAKDQFKRMMRTAIAQTAAKTAPTHKDFVKVIQGEPKAMPLEVQREDNKRNRQFYTFVQRLSGPQARADIQAGVVLLAGCQDSQLSYDGTTNGQFTEALLTVWSQGTFNGGYSQFHSRIMNIMPPDQVPNLFTINAGADFLDQRPFTP